MGQARHVEATVVLVRGGGEVTSWPLVSPRCPDIAVVDQLAHLQVLARRLGCRIMLRDVCPGLGELLDLAGLAGVLTAAG